MDEIKTIFDKIEQIDNTPEQSSDETATENVSVLLPKEKEALEEKIAQLEAKYNGSKVHAVVCIHPETKDRAVAFLREPNYLTSLRIMDKAAIMGIYTAADELRQAIIIKEESDPKTYGDTPECTPYKLGVTQYCMGMITSYGNQYKKK